MNAFVYKVLEQADQLERNKVRAAKFRKLQKERLLVRSKQQALSASEQFLD